MRAPHPPEGRVIFDLSLLPFGWVRAASHVWVPIDARCLSELTWGEGSIGFASRTDHTMALFISYGYAAEALVAGSPEARRLPNRGGVGPKAGCGSPIPARVVPMPAWMLAPAAEFRKVDA